MKLKLVLENGLEFSGLGEGTEKIGKVTFNTSMVGYQQIMYDKANFDDIVVMTYTLIGNYGINDCDYESDKVQIKGMIAKEFNFKPSNFRSNKSLTDLFMEEKVTFMYDLQEAPSSCTSCHWYGFLSSYGWHLAIPSIWSSSS